MSKRTWGLEIAAVLSVIAFFMFAGPIEVRSQTAPGKQLQPPVSSGQAPSTERKRSGAAAAPKVSHRLIIQLESPSLSEFSSASGIPSSAAGRIDLQSAAMTSHAARLEAKQNAFISAMKSAIPTATVSTYINEHGQSVQLKYKAVFNGMAIDPGAAGPEQAKQALEKLPGVKAVYRDYAHRPNLYASLPLIKAPIAWSNKAVRARSRAGAGVKIASMDGGIHKDAPMFDGTHFTYPRNFPRGGLGLTENNNGKIIASRTYFRSWDPPAPGDENPWPGEHGTSHGVHTSGIAAGNIVAADYAGADIGTVSGVAPAAWLMSYRVFYYSITADESFYTAEGIAALEDIAADGADIVNNSWGDGPRSTGGEFDPLDLALKNVAKAGVFVSMSAGNDGPYQATVEHPSADYITVASTSTAGSLASGSLSVTEPVPVSDPKLSGIALATPDFGPSVPLLEVLQYQYVTARSVDQDNALGCNDWPSGAFSGKAAVISRGSCNFSLKVLNAERAGAQFVIIYNDQYGGDSLMNMGSGDVGSQVGIPSVFIGHTRGIALEDWYDSAHARNKTASIKFSMEGFQMGNTPDVVAQDSSRGPGAGLVLKPDIAAPGVNILSQGYTYRATGEERHLGFGQASGTSMAAPHVSGAAALIRQIHPKWSNGYIKSALMSTAKYLDIYNVDGTPAQPLDMGAGRLDLTNAADPGVILDPSSLGFASISSGGQKSLDVKVTSVGTKTETFSLSTLYTGEGFNSLKPLAGFSVSPASITLAPGKTATFSVTFNGQKVVGPGDYQGYIILKGTTHQAHMPVHARLQPASDADILVIDADGSTLFGFTDYLAYYTDALQELGLTYKVCDTDLGFGNPTVLPDAATLSTYKTILFFTGDNFYTMFLSEADAYKLTEYANQGGKIIAMGQDLSDVAYYASFFYNYVLGGHVIQYGLTDGSLPDLPVLAFGGAPQSFQSLYLDLKAGGDGAGNQRNMDELQPIRESEDFGPSYLYSYMPVLKYSGQYNRKDGIVAITHRDQPSLERPGISYLGRSVCTSFGLEGVNNSSGYTSRAQVLSSFFGFVMDEPSVTIKASTFGSGMNFEAVFSSSAADTAGVSYRWDFGDGQGYSGPYPTDKAYHYYPKAGTYNVRVEASDSWGNRAVGTTTYVKPPGLIKVTIAPKQAAAAGAKWKLDNGDWNESGAVVSGIIPGRHIVSFSDVSGWTRPKDLSVAIVKNQTRLVTGTYRKK